ncbi:MAG: SAM-dependent methyltransferase [Lachnospiraceae bacterium]|nr:SAM-dependent methyltransferase [Lachnospiraceae bacterium]
MQLSKRLQMVVDFVTKGMRVADVGCDHAYISIYLIEHEIATNTIALDINKGPLMRAGENIKKYGYQDKIETRLSDGLKKLKTGEADTIVIAGMGGPLMVKILSDSMESVDAAKELVLQPQSEIDTLRAYLHNSGFAIVEEAMCKEDGKYYTAMRAVKKEEAGDTSDAVDPVFLHYGKWLLKDKNPVLQEFLKKEQVKTAAILESLENTDTEGAQSRKESLKKEIALLENALQFYA